MVRSRRKLLLWVLLFGTGATVFLAMAGASIVFLFFDEWAYRPDAGMVLNGERFDDAGGFDHWGRYISANDARELLQKADNRKLLSLRNGTVPITSDSLTNGRRVFYEETFGNEVFLTDIMGVVNGPFRVREVVRAITALKGEHTTNLRVRLADDFSAGGRTFRKGDFLDTGIDVAKGSLLPMGMPLRLMPQGVNVGISCAACHSTVDASSGKVIEGAPNSDLNTGVIMAMATNSAAYLPHSGVSSVDQFVEEGARMIRGRRRGSATIPLPRIDTLEAAVDADLVQWPPGFFDSTIDMVANPTKTPSSFTRHAWPYSYSGFAIAGSFHGLSVFSNNVHTQNSDSLSQAELAPALFGMHREQYLGVMLQNAADARYRYTTLELRPSQFLSTVDPSPASPGVNEIVPLPGYPLVNVLAPTGGITGTPGSRVWEEHHAVAAWQNTILPPEEDLDAARVIAGREVFKRAGCSDCHAGPALTNNRIVPAGDVGTEPSRARAFENTAKIFGEPVTWSFDNVIPIEPGRVMVIEAPMRGIDPQQITMGWGHDGVGGYKVPGLVGLRWTAPYLHDGGVAVGPDASAYAGLPNSLLAGNGLDARNSLLGLFDRDLRQRIMQANASSENLVRMHITGQGHEFWVDESAGFSGEEQRALIEYLLSVRPEAEE